MNTGLLQPRENESVVQERFAVIVESLSRQRHQLQCKSDFTNPSRGSAGVNFYLVRHGDALSAAENPRRPLSLDGRRRVEQTARLALKRNIQVSAIYHSGILRAQETAEILAAHIMPAASVAQINGLLPEDDPVVLRAELEAAASSILLVGHLPLMNRLAGLLVNGDPERPAVEFFPATMVCCNRAAPLWKINWQFAPQ